MSLTIPNTVYGSFKIIFFSKKTFQVNLHDEIRREFREDEKFTKEKVIRVLEKIKLKADLISFFTKPIVAIPLSGVILIGGLLIPSINLPLLILGIAVSAIGGGLTGFTIENYFRGSLESLSEAYHRKSKEANRYLQTLKSSSEDISIDLA